MSEADGADREAAIFHRGRIPKSLHDDVVADPVHDIDDDDDGDDADEERREHERENARTFVRLLKEKLVVIAGARGSVQMDSKLQEFASNFCHGEIRSGFLGHKRMFIFNRFYVEFSTHSPTSTAESSKSLILNADGVYLACYYSLHLNYYRHITGFYSRVRI